MYGGIFPSTWIQVSMKGFKGLKQRSEKILISYKLRKRGQGKSLLMPLLRQVLTTFLFWDKNVGGNPKWEEYFLLLAKFLSKSEKKVLDIEASPFCFSCLCYLKHTIHKSSKILLYSLVATWLFLKSICIFLVTSAHYEAEHRVFCISVWSS